MFSRFSKLSKIRINKIVPFKRAKDAELADKLQKTNHRVVLSKSTTIFKTLTIQKSDYEDRYKGKSADEIKEIDIDLDRQYDVIVLFPTGKNENYDFKKEKKIAKNQPNNNLVATNNTLVHPKISGEEKIVSIVSDDDSVYTNGSGKNIPEYIKFKKSASIMSDLSHEEKIVSTVSGKNIPEYIKFNKSASIISDLSHEENLDTLSVFQKKRLDI